ncbi:hypothetical protein H0H87_001957, partial [Tephrocybe sp. NHM501043]
AASDVSSSPSSDASSDEEDEEIDDSLLTLDEFGLREMALVDWARARILDGHWISPADSWYGHRMPGWEKGWVRAVHPLAWSLVEDVDVSPTSGEEGDGVEDEGEERGQHPTPQTLRQPVPPTFGLCEAAFAAHTRSLKGVLVPPMRNLVRKLVIECQTPGMLASDSSSYLSTNTKRDRGRTEDPAIRAAKMGIEEVLEVLRNEEGVWLEGFDWVGQWRDQQQRQRAPDASGDRGWEEESDDTGSSAGSVASGRSTGTSPVLSTSTLQTTPSPSPIVSDDDVKSSPPSPAVEIILVEDDQDAQQQEREPAYGCPPSVAVFLLLASVYRCFYIPSHTTTPTSHRTFTLIKELARSNRVNGINGQTEAREM